MLSEIAATAAVALAASGAQLPADPQASPTPAAQPAVAPGGPITAKLITPRPVAGGLIVITGRAAPREPVKLQARTAGQRTWRTVTRADASRDGRFLLLTGAKATSRMRVVSATAPAAAAATTAPTGAQPEAAAADPAAAAVPQQQQQAPRSVALRVPVAARLTSLDIDNGHHSASTIRGQVKPARVGRRVELMARTEHGNWKRVARTRTRHAGRFKTTWRPRTGHAVVRARFTGDERNTRAVSRSAHVATLRPALASWYGPGFLGNMTACGQRLYAWTPGVAHKSLPCGTMVTISYQDRTARVPVIDRGPFVGPREFDIAQAAKVELGFEGVDTIWVSH